MAFEDSILIQLMKQHAPEIAEKLESNNAVAAAGGIEDPVTLKHENEAVGTDAAVKRQKVA